MVNSNRLRLVINFLNILVQDITKRFNSADYKVQKRDRIGRVVFDLRDPLCGLHVKFCLFSENSVDITVMVIQIKIELQKNEKVLIY